MDLPREAGPPGAPGLHRTLTAPFGLFSPGIPSRKPSAPGVFPGPCGGRGRTMPSPPALLAAAAALFACWAPLRAAASSWW